MRRLAFTLLIALVPLLHGCAITGGGLHFADERQDEKKQEEEREPGVEVGIASYYASFFHGRTTANGEEYDRRLLTAAHRTLPFGTRVLVTNLENDKRIIVRINDRGPFIKGRIIDLSRRAARELDFVRDGTTRVEVRVLDD